MTTENKTPANWQDGLRMADRIAEIANNTLLACTQLPDDGERVLLLTAAVREINRLTGGRLGSQEESNAGKIEGSGSAGKHGGGGPERS
jgi:hypothetical protein